ncbi:MAG: hypothetical protein HYW79_01285 [Parcubacteria group bacterium]|nr:hypothetical protein [Parcubacteria group bacterium]
MKIMICSSMQFAKEMLTAKEALETNGHSIVMSQDVSHYSDNPNTKEVFNDELKQAQKGNSLYEGLERVAESDALLILNYPKNRIEGYIGTSVLMEIGLGYYLKKKIYFLYPIDKNQKYALEIALVKPTILDGDLNKI